MGVVGTRGDWNIPPVFCASRARQFAVFDKWGDVPSYRALRYPSNIGNGGNADITVIGKHKVNGLINVAAFPLCGVTALQGDQGKEGAERGGSDGPRYLWLRG